MTEPRIRPYRAEDRADVRRICVETGYLGDPVWWLYPDAESFADLFCTWYVDHEPEHVWVVDDGTGRARGYLLGATDTRAVPSPATVAARHVLGRALALRAGTAPFWWRAVGDVVRAGGQVDHDVDLDRWPAHLHIDLLPEVRGRGLGRRLLATWLEVLDDLDVPGVHVSTFAENATARRFFAGAGFTGLGPARPAPGFRSRDGARLHTVALVRDLP